MMTEALDAGPQDTVLEVGTGSGYQAAVLAELAGEVLTIERQPGLADLAARRLRRLGYRNCGGGGGGRRRRLPRAPFSRILVAAAPRGCPGADRAAGPGGRLVIPVGEAQQQLLLLTRARTAPWSGARLAGCASCPSCPAWRPPSGARPEPGPEGCR